MPHKVLILDPHAQDYHARLRQQFPDVAFHPAINAGEAMPVIADIDISVAVAHGIPRELIAAARSLKLVLALTTGTDALIGVLPSHILLTSTRGVHGPQMSELAFLHMLA